MKTMRNGNGAENNRRLIHSMNHDRMRSEERNQSRSTVDGGERSYENEDTRWHSSGKNNHGWDDYGLSHENNFGNGREFGIAVDNKRKHESERKSTENREEGTYRNKEKDVRGEFAVRGNHRIENDSMEEDHRWKIHDSTNFSEEDDEENEYGSGTDETIGVP